MAAESFPKLEQLLQHLGSGLRDFGLNEIYDLLRNRRNREFLKKAKQQLKFLHEAITEIQRKCIDLQQPPDPGQIKFLLWRAISRASHVGHGTLWNADQIGRAVVAQLRTSTDQRLVCIPLFGSVAPWKEPQMYPLAKGVWLIEPSISTENLLRHLEALLGDFPEEIAAQLNSIDEPTESEFCALLLEPLIACHSKGFFAGNEYALRRFGIPLIALHNIVTINRIDSSDSLALWGWMTKSDPPDWPDDLQAEWFSLNDAPNGLTLPHDRVSVVEASKRVASYDLDCNAKPLNPVFWGSKGPGELPPVLILPSLLHYSLTSRLILYGQRISELPASELDRRIAHAVLIWTKACANAQEIDWEIGFEEYDQSPVLDDPDLLIMYSTIVLESLFSSPTDKQEVTSRIADLTAGLLGNLPGERYDLSTKVKKAYGSRSEFVHGSVDRPAKYANDAMWLFKIATLALWRTVDTTIAVGSPYQDWSQFIEYIQRRKFGA